MYQRNPTLLNAIVITFILSVDNILNIHAKGKYGYNSVSHSEFLSNAQKHIKLSWQGDFLDKNYNELNKKEGH